MEKELNYLSERIENIRISIVNLKRCISTDLGVGGRIKTDYDNMINSHTIEVELLENILNVVTLNLLPSSLNNIFNKYPTT